MPMDLMWATFVRPGAWNGGSGSWSQDVEFGPSTVFAFTTMQTFSQVDADGYAVEVSSGVMQYRTRDPNTGVESLHNVGANQNWGSVPAIFDNNVDSVTFNWSATAESFVTADMVFYVFVFD